MQYAYYLIINFVSNSSEDNCYAIEMPHKNYKLIVLYL